MSNCLLCFKNDNNLLNVNEHAQENVQFLMRLKKCVPEVDWEIIFEICEQCVGELNAAYEFRKKCLSSRNKMKGEIMEEEKFDINCEDRDFHDDSANDDTKHSDGEEIIVEFNCYECNKGFNKKSALQLHITGKHSNGLRKKIMRRKKFSCEKCYKMYATEKAVQKHSRICKESVEGKETETLLKEVNSSKGSDEPTCRLCGTTFCDKYKLKRHIKNVHTTEKKYKCELCNGCFASPVYLNAHKRYHKGDRSYICTFCGKGFITTSDLYHHEKIHLNKKEYKCEICSKAFNKSSHLQRHKICSHKDRSEWKYICEFCSRPFPIKTNLDTHRKTHTGEKNFLCHLCDKKFINKSVLLRHVETHSNVVAFKCDLCMQAYKYRKSLDLHLAKVHGIGNVTIPERVKKYFCHLCPKSFFANNKLQKHLRGHNGEKPFACSHCDKSFTDKSYVKQHLKLTHGVVDFG